MARADIDPWRAAALGACGAICAALVTVFIVIDLLSGHPTYALLAAAGLPVGLLTIVLSRRRPAPPIWAPYPLALTLVAMLSALPHVGPQPQGAGLMWYCAMPPYLLFTLGPRVGLAFSTMLFGALLVALSGPDPMLQEAFALRYGAAYLSITATIYVYEARRKSAEADLAARKAEIRRLEGLLNICGWCHKRIRDETGAWVPMERFLQDRAPIQISHGLCPNCEHAMERDLEQQAPGRSA